MLNRAEELENMLHTMAEKNASACCSVNARIHYQVNDNEVIEYIKRRVLQV